MRRSSPKIAPSFLIPLGLLFRSSPPRDAALFLGAVLLHEAGHLLALRAFGYPARFLSLSVTGAVIHTEEAMIPYRKEWIIFLAGPLANAIGAGLAILFLRSRFSREGMLFFSFNALLGLLNLMPIRGLDGAGALRAFFCQWGEEETAERFAALLHRIFLAILFAGAVLLLVRERNPSLLILTVAFLWQAPKKRKKATTAS